MSDPRDDLRGELRRRRRAIPAAQRIEAAQALASEVLSLPTLPDAGPVAGYWAVDGEIALHVLQLRLPPSLTYCLPVIDDAGIALRFAPWRPGDPLRTNQYGIPEPDVAPDRCFDPREMALVLVPLVGFDRHGHRLGMGGGYYDRTFAFRSGNTSPPPLLLGTGFAVQEVESISVAPWDVPMDAIVTEHGTLARNGGQPVDGETA